MNIKAFPTTRLAPVGCPMAVFLGNFYLPVEILGGASGIETERCQNASQFGRDQKFNENRTGIKVINIQGGPLCKWSYGPPIR